VVGPGSDSRRKQEYLFLLGVQAGSRAKSAYYSMGTKDYCLGVHRPGPEADHSLLVSRLMSGTIPPFHPYVLIVCIGSIGLFNPFLLVICYGVGDSG
jgi:hypothetical protein